MTGGTWVMAMMVAGTACWPVLTHTGTHIQILLREVNAWSGIVFVGLKERRW